MEPNELELQKLKESFEKRGLTPVLDHILAGRTEPINISGLPSTSYTRNLIYRLLTLAGLKGCYTIKCDPSRSAVFIRYSYRPVYQAPIIETGPSTMPHTITGITASIEGVTPAPSGAGISTDELLGIFDTTVKED